MENRRYRAVLEASSDGYNVFFPDFDGCTSWGATLDEAASHAADALALFLEFWEGPLPDPSALNAPIDPEAVPAALVLVQCAAEQRRLAHAQLVRGASAPRREEPRVAQLH